MPSKAKGSVVLAMTLFLGSAPMWAASVQSRPAFAESSAGSSFSEVALGALARWLGAVWESSSSAATVIWGEYGIAIDPNGIPTDPSHNAVALPADPNTP